MDDALWGYHMDYMTALIFRRSSELLLWDVRGSLEGSEK